MTATLSAQDFYEEPQDLGATTVVSEQAPASDPEVDTRVAATTKLSGNLFETPRAVETVTREQFEERGARNLEETLNYASGVQSGYYGLDTRQDFVRVRGLNSTNYKDGLRHQFNFYNNTPQEAFAVEQIDVVKGPASVLFGQGTVGGTVNTSSKIAGAGVENEIMAGYGSHDRYEVGLDYNSALDEAETFFFRLVGYYRDADTYIDYVEDDSRFLMPSFTWQPSEQTRLSLLLNLQENNSTPSLMFFPIEATQIPGFTLDNDTYGGEPSMDRYDTKQASVNVLFDHEFNDIFSFSANARYVASEAEYVEHTLVPPGIGALLSNALGMPPLPAGTYHRILYGADHETDVFAGNAILKADFATGVVDHNLQFGVDYTYADRDRHTLPIGGIPGFGVPYIYSGIIDLTNPSYGASASLPALSDNLQVTEKMVGLFLHDQIRWNNLILSGGVRFDDYEQESNKTETIEIEQWSFDGGIMYQLPYGISPYYSYAESFEPQGVNTATNEPLDPKTGSQHELGVKWMPNSDTLITASYFQIEEDNRVIGSGGPDVEQSSVEVDGAELALRQRCGDFYLQASYTYLDTANNDRAGSPQLAGVPENQASAWVSYRPAGTGFRTGLGVRYTGESYDGLDAVRTKSHTLLDAMVGYQWQDWDFQLNVTNLLDKQYVQTHEFSPSYGSTNAFLGQDRSVNLSATLTF
ncbi:TonB-dependent siderophore receptor [Roseibacillus ishigakijimensis]|uniref:TonB-dependent siderophore receptor n=1 Tax=Roseibacillus ishigakijimensis TaxID=454146 RepID=A0A934RP03_9BACT|nr:TonB-dependent siderophore receptor [Roseibacillus ishigakijimensis]MBK1834884.1 TonB-dependent siderophore receptor [Roseibacillus ishigakijimensis]